MPGESLYTHFLTPDADVIDDTLVYRRGWDNYLVVVNASNDDKDRTWLESVRDGKVKIDNAVRGRGRLATTRKSATCVTRKLWQ
jgi:glycine cleavage system aminomethyltransferase T